MSNIRSTDSCYLNIQYSSSSDVCFQNGLFDQGVSMITHVGATFSNMDKLDGDAFCTTVFVFSSSYLTDE